MQVPEVQKVLQVTIKKDTKNSSQPLLVAAMNLKSF